MKAERDRSKTEMKDLQQQLSEMHDELDQAKRSEEINTEKEVLLKVNENTSQPATANASPQGSSHSRCV